MTVVVLILLILKLTVIPTMAWWVVFLPYVIPATFFICTMLAFVTLFVVTELLKK